MDSTNDDYAKKLYPVQRRPKVVSEADDASLSGEKKWDEGRRISVDSSNEAKKSKPGPGKKVAIATPPATRRASDQNSNSAFSRRMSSVLAASVFGPHGQRQSTHIDYDFYNHLMARKSLVSTLTKSEESKAEAAWREASTALKRIRIPGLHHFAEAATLAMRVFWLVLFIVCVIIVLVEIGIGINHYLNNPVVTTFTINTPATMAFPQIYICMGNAMNRTYMSRHPDAAAASDMIYGSLVGGDKKRRKRSVGFGEDHRVPWQWTFEEYVHSLRTNQLEEEEDDDDPYMETERWRRSILDEKANHSLQEWRSNGELVYEFLLDAGFKVSETFLNCSFRGYSERSHDCNDVVTPVLDPNYFKCFVVKVPEDEMQVVAGKGMSLLINSQVSLYPRYPANETKPNKNSGLFVSVSDKFDPTNWYKGVVKPGTLTKLSLSATRMKLLNIKRKSLSQPCVADGTKLYHVFNTSYSRTACQMDCMLFAFYKTCRCILLTHKSLVRQDILQTTPFCTSNERDCLKSNVTNSKEVMDNVNKCREKCHTPCDSTRYDMRGSWSMLNPTAFPGKVPVEDLIQLELAFGALQISKMEQSESKTIAQLIADMGGQVNLWIGASIIILLQIPLMIGAHFCYRGYGKIIDYAWIGY